MTKEELQVRIEKKQKDIQKINKRIAKWSKGLRPEDIAVCKAFENVYYGEKPRNLSWSDYHGTTDFQTAHKAYKDYYEANKNNIPSADDWNKGPNIGETYNAYRDLGEANHTLEKYIIELDKLVNFEQQDKIEVIWNFLQNWRKAAYEYYVNQVATYDNLRQHEEEAFNEYLIKNNKVEEAKNYWTKYGLERAFLKDYYFGIDSLTKNIYLRHGKFDEDKLNKILDKEVQTRYNKLVNEVTAITGPITDASNLRMRGLGEINGIIIGQKGKANVQTFGAGGYNIQIFHYRTRVDPVA